jgi:sec-independent protein translocase protein TatB
MFDISFAELVVVGIVALIIIGPEKLPAVARTAGYFIGRARRYVERVKHELREEVELDSLRKLRDSVHETVDSFENSVRTEINEISKIQKEVTPRFTTKSEETDPTKVTEHSTELNKTTSSSPPTPKKDLDG